MIYSATAKGGYKVPIPFDPDEIKIVGIIYQPDAWASQAVYYKRSADDYDIVIPSVFAGLYYKCTNPGLSGSAEPTWPTVPGQKVTDGTVIWEAVAYNLMNVSETLQTSTWTASDVAITLTDDLILTGKTCVIVSTIPETLESFSLTNHIVKSNGEASDVTLIFKVASR